MANRSVDPALTYESGGLRFDPIPAGYTPSVSKKDAYATFKKTGVYSSTDEYSTPSVNLVAMTTFTQRPSFTKRPVWLVRFTGVPTYGSGGPRLPGSRSTGPQKPLFQDVISGIDAATGTELFVEIATPDPVALTWAQPSDDGAKSRVRTTR